jgi:hypothetical protein
MPRPSRAQTVLELRRKRPVGESLKVRLNWWWLAPVLVLGALGATVNYRMAVPERSHWKAATDHVRTQLQAGDGVAWAPYWASEGRLYFEGLPGFHLPQVNDADLSRFGRVWLLGAFGRNADDLPSGHTLVERTVFGGVTLDLVQVGGERVRTDLYRQLQEAVVTRTAASSELNCDFWDGRGWHCIGRKDPRTIEACLGESTRQRLQRHRRRRQPHCGLDPWLNVSRDVRVIGSAPRRCVWVHPVVGKQVKIRLPKADFGNELVLKHGFTDKVITDNYRDSPRTRPVSVQVKRGEVVIGQRTIEPVSGWREWRIETESGQAELEVLFETEVHLDAHLCIDLTTRGERP